MKVLVHSMACGLYHHHLSVTMSCMGATQLMDCVHDAFFGTCLQMANVWIISHFVFLYVLFLDLVWISFEFMNYVVSVGESWWSPFSTTLDPAVTLQMLIYSSKPCVLQPFAEGVFIKYMLVSEAVLLLWLCQNTWKDAYSLILHTQLFPGVPLNTAAAVLCVSNTPPMLFLPSQSLKLSPQQRAVKEAFVRSRSSEKNTNSTEPSAWWPLM